MDNDASTMTPRILVSCQAAERAGLHYRQWIDAAQPIEMLRDAFDTLLASSPCRSAEDAWLIVDTLDFAGISSDELRNLEEVSALGMALATHGPVVGKLRRYFDSVAETLDALQDSYVGTFDSAAEWAEARFLDDVEIPERVLPYINYEAFVRDAESAGHIISIRLDDGVYIFEVG